MKTLQWSFVHRRRATDAPSPRTERRPRHRARDATPTPASPEPMAVRARKPRRRANWAFPRGYTEASPRLPEEREAEAVAVAAVEAAPSVPSRRPMRLPRADEPAMSTAEVHDRADDFTRWRTRHLQLHRQQEGNMPR
jgi:hypothetical protein